MVRLGIALLVVVASAACGRIGYDADPDAAVGDPDGAIDGVVDSDVDADPFQPKHQYRLQGDYHDDFGGPDLVPAGGALVAGGYQFGANQGLSVSGAMADAVYTVSIDFSFDTLTSWRKIVDFKGLATDEGFYTFDDKLQFVIVAGVTFETGLPRWLPNVTHRVTLTRDSAGLTIGYVDSDKEWHFSDDAQVATLTGPGAPVHFFIDDNATGMGEASGGVVRRIRIWDQPLSISDLPP